MSRIGIKPASIPAGVEVTVDAKNVVTVKGPKGELSQQVNKDLKVEVVEGNVVVSRPSDARLHKAQHGLARTLISNLIEGVSNGFSKKLVIEGVGYKAEKKGDDLVMNLGYSHQVIMKDPQGITTEVPTATQIIIKGNGKAVVGNYAANIRKWRKPEPYKGKGIRYEGEFVRRKEGKTGAK